MGAGIGARAYWPACRFVAGALETSRAIFTSASHDHCRLVTKKAPLQGKLLDMNGNETALDRPASERTAPALEASSRVDLHCHSAASEISKLGVQRAVGLPECATPPREVYALAKRRGMDFVTITDHDTIEGVLEIADRPDVFISEELTARFRGEPQAVHVLCYGITAGDHEWLQAHSGDVELCAGYMLERDITCALAHPYYTVAAPLNARHRRRLAELFGVWEIRNGARARELNRPAATYVATREAIGIGGSDDHAGVDIGRTYSETPRARDPRELLAHVRAGNVLARGAHGSAAKWAHAAIALAARSLGRGRPYERPRRPDPARVMTMVRRLLREGEARHGPVGNDLTPEDARCLLHAWLCAVELDHLDTLTGTLHEGGEAGESELIAYMQADDFSHADLYRRACRLHERKLRVAVDVAVAAAAGEAEVTSAAEGLFEACIAAIPYAPATAFLAGEQAKLAAIPDSAGVCSADDRTGRGQGLVGRGARMASARAWRSSPTESARHMGSPARSRRSASAASPASRSTSSAPIPRSTGACRRWRKSMCRSTRACESACPASPAPYRRSRASTVRATRRSTCAHRAPPASPARSSHARSASRWWAATTPS
jgi:predicted metal-dependent phosphoesterase TrpH